MPLCEYENQESQMCSNKAIARARERYSFNPPNFQVFQVCGEHANMDVFFIRGPLDAQGYIIPS